MEKHEPCKANRARDAVPDLPVEERGWNEIEPVAAAIANRDYST